MKTRFAYGGIQTKRTTNQRASSHHMWSRVQNILKVMYAVYPWRRHGMANSGALWVALNSPEY